MPRLAHDRVKKGRSLTEALHTTQRLSRDILRRALSGHHGRVAAAACLTLAALSLSGSNGGSQKAAADPYHRVVTLTGGRFTPAAMRALTRDMDPLWRALANQSLPGRAAWTPAGPLGWASYDIDTPPSLIWRDLTFDDARGINGLVPISPLPILPMNPFVLPAKGAERDRAMQCLTQAIYYEAGFESGEGQEAVAQVILNRLRHPAYPKSVCGVVYQGSQRATGCQFSFTCDGSLSRPVSATAWQRAQFVAKQALAGFVYKGVGPSTHYHADYVFPYWAVTLVKLTQIGAHIFYRMTGPSGAPDAFDGRYAGGETALSESVLTGGDTRTPDAPSAVLPPTIPVAATRTITLETGGETRTYTVAIPPAPGALPAPDTAGGGMLRPIRRQPTPDEVKQINESLLKFEEERHNAANAAAAPGQIGARPSRVLEAPAASPEAKAP